MNDPGSSYKLTALAPSDLVLLLQRSGSRTASMALLERQFAAGLPRNPNGTVNFFEYLAYLLKPRS